MKKGGGCEREGFTAMSGKKIAIGAGGRVEHLPEDRAIPPISTFVTQRLEPGRLLVSPMPHLKERDDAFGTTTRYARYPIMYIETVDFIFGADYSLLS